MYHYELHLGSDSRYFVYDEKVRLRGSVDSIRGMSDFSTDTLFVDENWFRMITYEHTLTLDKPFSAVDFYDLCQQDYADYLLQGEQYAASLWSFFVDKVLVDGTPSAYFIGQTGVVDMDMYLLFLRYDVADHIRDKGLSKSLVLPASLSTVYHVKRELAYDDFVLLYLFDDAAKLVQIVGGRYHHVATINLGKKKLIRMIEESGLMDLFRAVESGSLVGSGLSRSLEEIYLFYIGQLLSWLQESCGDVDRVVLVGGGLSYPIFTQLFYQEFRRISDGFLVPLHLDFVDNYYGDAMRTDILCFQYYERDLLTRYYQQSGS